MTTTNDNARRDGVRSIDCSASYPPLQRAFTREQLQESAKTWMKANADGYTKEGYYTSLGLLVDFVTDLFDGVNVDQPNDRTHPRG